MAIDGKQNVVYVYRRVTTARRYGNLDNRWRRLGRQHGYHTLFQLRRGKLQTSRQPLRTDENERRRYQVSAIV